MMATVFGRDVFGGKKRGIRDRYWGEEDGTVNTDSRASVSEVPASREFSK